MLLARKRKIVAASSSGGVPSPLLDDLVSYWSFDSDWTDIHGTNDLTNVNGITSVPGKLGNAGDFEASSSQALACPTNASLPVGDVDFTCAFWFRVETLAESNCMGQDNVHGQRGYTVGINPSNRPRFLVSTSPPTAALQATGSFAISTWYFVVAWHDAIANTINLQINDGIVEIIGTNGPADITNADFVIGASHASLITPPYYYFFDGLIDEVALWHRVLTADERTQLYNSGNGLAYPFDAAPAPQPFNGLVSVANLVSYWKLDEASGNRLDSHGTNHLTPTNSPVGAAGKISNGCDFESSSSQYLSHADPSPLGDEDWTYAFWCKPESLGNPTLLAKSASLDYFVDIYEAGGVIRFNINGGVRSSSVSVTPTIGQWYFIMAWYDAIADQLGLQVNNDVPNIAGNNVSLVNSGGPVTIGARPGGVLPFDGIIDEVSLWRRVLTPAERTALYNSGNGLTY